MAVAACPSSATRTNQRCTSLVQEGMRRWLEVRRSFSEELISVLYLE